MKKFTSAMSALSIVTAAPLCVALVSASDQLTVDAVIATEADPDYGEYLAGECMTCHTREATNIPQIHGKEPAYIAAALIEYKYETRENETMRSIAGVMGKDEIAALAAYFSSLPE